MEAINYSKIDIPPIDSCGWYQDGSIQWIDKAFPDEISDILLDPDYYMMNMKVISILMTI